MSFSDVKANFNRVYPLIIGTDETQAYLPNIYLKNYILPMCLKKG
ncbi:hypothetical protein N752_19765 [Desulforamulus aquiferis]|nr:hypothetical protein N752_19765 [Desulforamulus aquiferis]